MNGSVHNGFPPLETKFLCVTAELEIGSLIDSRLTEEMKALRALPEGLGGTFETAEGEGRLGQPNRGG